MIRLFVPVSLYRTATVLLEEKQRHYLLNVMRLKMGDAVAAFNGVDGEWLCCLVIESKKKAFLQVQEQTRVQNSLPPCILCPALIKKENMELIFQKATELGVTMIIPVVTQRTVVRCLNMDRASVIVTEAAEQSERLTVPVVCKPISLFELFDVLPSEAQIIFLSERGGQAYINQSVDFPAFLIGPEGGFTPQETDFLNSHERVIPTHLGKTILRAETACIAIMACWKYRLFR